MKTTICLFKRKAYKPVNLKEANSILSYVKKVGGYIRLGEYIPAIHGSLKNNCYIEDGMRFIYMTCRYKGKVATYVFDKITASKKEAGRVCALGMKAYNCLLKFVDKQFLRSIVRPENMVEGNKNILPFSTSPFLWFNEKYNRQESDAISYDMNSAYSYAMLGDMPDTSEVKSVDIKCYNLGIVRKGEIGFDAYGNLVKEGCFALFRFKTIPSPFKKFVDYYYFLKKNAKNKEIKQHAKDILNMSVGYLQRINPFIRATIVSRANNLIKDLIDKNTLYCNTDSIVSLKPRKDLTLGEGLGEWKVEHKGKFRYVDYNYQWDNTLPSYRGIPKAWFNESYNILTDDIPVCGNLYELDYIKFIIRKVK